MSIGWIESFLDECAFFISQPGFSFGAPIFFSPFIFSPFFLFPAGGGGEEGRQESREEARREGRQGGRKGGSAALQPAETAPQPAGENKKKGQEKKKGEK